MAIEGLTQTDVFGFLSPRQVDTLSNASEITRFEGGDVVYLGGDKADFFYIVLSGEVVLTLPGKEKARVAIDRLSKGAMFGSCFPLASGTYSCTARCANTAELLKIRSEALKKILDEDPRMGYAIQCRISQIYFKRYVETIGKLQSIIMNIPFESE
jgi:CRP-like cAMP-binding protein